jgi:hypothetical protein
MPSKRQLRWASSHAQTRVLAGSETAKQQRESNPQSLQNVIKLVVDLA